MGEIEINEQHISMATAKRYSFTLLQKDIHVLNPCTTGREIKGQEINPIPQRVVEKKKRRHNSINFSKVRGYMFNNIYSILS